MAYTGKTDWKYDDIVTEQDFNRIEQGVEESINTANQASVRAVEAENNSKAYTDLQIQLVTETGIPKLVTYPFVLTAEADEQTDFIIPLETFDKETDTLLVVQNSTVLSTERFSLVEDKKIRLLEGVSTGTKIFVQVFKNVPIGPEGAINGGVIAVNSLPSDRVQGFDELFTSVSDGKAQLETAIADKDGTVSKQGDVATFDELDEGIRSIPQAKGNATSGQVLAGRTFSSESAGIEAIGTMENRGSVNQIITTQNGQFTIPAGYHSGDGKVTASFANLTPNRIAYGTNIGGIIGTLLGGSNLSPIVYDYGVENWPININGYSIGSGTRQKEANRLFFSVNGSSRYVNVRSMVSTRSINFDNIAGVKITWSATGTGGIWRTIGLSPDPNSNHHQNTHAYTHGQAFSLRTEVWDVTTLMGAFFIKIIHADWPSDGSFEYDPNGTMSVYKIELIPM